MAAPGHYKAIQSSNPGLEVKRAGKRHVCAGLAVERGERPGKLKDVWLFGRSRLCVGVIEDGSYYVANSLLPSHVLASLIAYERWLPTCLACALEAYSEYLTGPVIAQYLRPLTPARRKDVTLGLVGILQEARTIAADVDAE